MSVLDEILPKKFESKERFRSFEVCEILDCSKRTLSGLDQRGDLNPIYTTENIKLYTRADLEQYLAVRQLESLQNRAKPRKIS